MSALDFTLDDLRNIDGALCIAAASYRDAAAGAQFLEDRAHAKRDAAECRDLADRIGRHLAGLASDPGLNPYPSMLMDTGPFSHERTAPSPTGGTVELWAECNGDRMAARYINADGDMIRIVIYPTADAAVADPAVSWGLPAKDQKS
jgi:hypothetical protein